GCQARADVASGARNVLDKKLLSKTLAELLPHEPRERVSHAARRERNDQTYRPCRIGLRPRNTRRGGKRGSSCCQMQKSSAPNFHRFLPLRKATALRDLAKGAMTDVGC